MHIQIYVIVHICYRIVLLQNVGKLAAQACLSYDIPVGFKSI